MDKEINVVIEKPQTELLVIRKGEALPLREPVALNLAGNIDAVNRFINKRIAEFEQKTAHILVDRDNLSIMLVFDETSYFKGTVSAVAELDTAFQEFQVNTGKSWTTMELSNFIRMRRAYFENSDVAIKLVTDLRNFKAKINKDLENADDNRGNKDIVRRQTVESNIPENFKIEIPLFKGFGKRTIEIEIDIDADTLSCRLVSPHAAEVIINETNTIIDDQLKEIEEKAPEIVVIEK